MNAIPARERAIANYQTKYGREPSLVVRAPGRVNLIGEHTDYNDGFVLPMALPYEIVIAGEPRADGQVIAESEGFAPATFSILDEVSNNSTWFAYMHGTAAMLRDSGYAIEGWQACLASDIPAGASLSSSAALEVASGLAFISAAGGQIEGAKLAKIGQRVENEVMGLPSGIMDQLASATCQEGSASLIDCRDLTSSSVPLPDGVDIVIMDTGSRRELVDSLYAARREACERAASEIGVRALRDATLDQLEQLSDPLLHRRAHHVITENTRTLAAATAMESGDALRLGQLMNESHTSLRDNFEVSGPALDAIVEVARSITGCLGARMTGGGFAGAAVALVDSTHTEAFIATVLKTFVAPTQQPSTSAVQLYAVRPAPGASVLVSPFSSP